MRTINMLLLIFAVSVGYLIAQEPESVMEPVMEEVEEITPVMEEVIKKHIVPNQQQDLDDISDFLLKGEIINMLAAWSTLLKNPENKDVNIDTAIQYIIQKVEKQRTALFEPREDITIGEFRAKIEGEITRSERMISDFNKIKKDPKEYQVGTICCEVIDLDSIISELMWYLEVLELKKRTEETRDDAEFANTDLQNWIKLWQERIRFLQWLPKGITTLLLEYSKK